MREFASSRRTPQEWRALIKKVACYAHGLGPRLFGDGLRYRESGSEIASLTLSLVRMHHKGYVFRDGYVLYYYFLCHACLRTAQALQRAGGQNAEDQSVGGQRDRELAGTVEEDDDTPEELCESAAAAFLQQRRCLDAFLAFIKDKKLKGKQRAYGLGFPRYSAEGWDVERIAKDLRVTPATIGKYRSQLREFLEDFEILRERRSKARPA